MLMPTNSAVGGRWEVSSLSTVGWLTVSVIPPVELDSLVSEIRSCLL